MKRVTMGGTDPVITDDQVADLILDYAKELGRTGMTDTITVPAALGGQAVEASMLLGPASQITLITLSMEIDAENLSVELAGIDATRTGLQQRIDWLTGRVDGDHVGPETSDAFPDLDQFGP